MDGQSKNYEVSIRVGHKIQSFNLSTKINPIHPQKRKDYPRYIELGLDGTFVHPIGLDIRDEF